MELTRAIEILERRTTIPGEDCSYEEIMAAYDFAIKKLKALIPPELTYGMSVWYYCDDVAVPEKGTICDVCYKDGKLYSFGVDFGPGDFSEFDGDELGNCIFTSEEAAYEHIKEIR